MAGKLPVPQNRRTFWSNCFEGDVEIPEICIYSLTTQCPDKYKGCSRLHSKKKYHWQLLSENEWYNFHQYHSDGLEKAFWNANNDEARIPPLDPSKIKTNEHSMFRFLGSDYWKANFQQMQLIRLKDDKNFTIRRLSTPSIGKYKSKFSTEYIWYFFKCDKWVEFSTVGCNSNEIEKQYQKDRNSVITVNATSSQDFVLKFTEMEMTNIGLSVIPVRRRPKRDDDVEFPTVWSYYANGDVEIPEICMNTINGKCALNNGCGRLHSENSSYWQVLHNGLWYNLSRKHRITLENSYCDVNKSDTILPPINPSRMGNLGISLEKILGLAEWFVEFDDMIMYKADDPKVKMKIRRLSTPSAINSQDENATTFLWYYKKFFKPKYSKWIAFPSDKGDEYEPTWDANTTTEEIEKRYIEGEKDYLDVIITEGLYELIFHSMKLVSSNASQKDLFVRRRPLKSETSVLRATTTVSTDSDDINRGTSVCARVTEDRKSIRDKNMKVIYEISQKENKLVRFLILSDLTLSVGVDIKKIQNRRLVQNFEARQKWISSKCGPDSCITSYLYHWVSKEAVEDICHMNFNNSHQCPDIKASCLAGVRFFKSAKFDHQNCPYSHSIRDHTLIIFDVLLGKLQKSEDNIVQKTCFTVVDSISDPNVFTKCDDRDYCPLYLIQF